MRRKGGKGRVVVYRFRLRPCCYRWKTQEAVAATFQEWDFSGGIEKGYTRVMRGEGGDGRGW